MTFPENLTSVRVYRFSNVTQVGLSEAHDLPSIRKLSSDSNIVIQLPNFRGLCCHTIGSI